MNPQKINNPLTVFSSSHEQLIIQQVSVSHGHNPNRGFRISPLHSANPSALSSICNTPIHESDNILSDINSFSKKLKERGLIEH